MAVRLMVPNSMAGRDLPQALDRHVECGLRELDLKSDLLGRKVQDLTPEEAGRIKVLARGRPGPRGFARGCGSLAAPAGHPAGGLLREVARLRLHGREGLFHGGELAPERELLRHHPLLEVLDL